MNLFLRLVIFVFLTQIFTSCSPFKKGSVTFPQMEENSTFIEVQHDSVELLLFGDYLLHPFKEKWTMNWDEAFVTSIKSDENPKPELLFASHTFLQPHCTLVAMHYPQVQDATASTYAYLETAAISLLKERKNIGNQDYDIVSYDLLDPELEIYIFHIDYFLSSPTGIYRFSFWSTDRDRKWLFRESTAVLEKLKIKNL